MRLSSSIPSSAPTTTPVLPRTLAWKQRLWRFSPLLRRRSLAPIIVCGVTATMGLLIIGGVTATVSILSSSPTTSLPPTAQTMTAAPIAPTKPVQIEASKLPLYFIENHGQVDDHVAYYVQGKDASVYFAPTGATFVLRQSAAPDGTTAQLQRVALHAPRPASEPPPDVLTLDFVGANPRVRPQGRDKTAAVISYFRGAREQWQTGLPTYSSVVYPELWPGIDLVYSGDNRRLKYTFVVKPRADPRQILLAYHGATDLHRANDGSLIVRTPGGGFSEEKPYVYQEINGQQVPVTAAYVTEYLAAEKSHRYRFQLGAHNPEYSLIVDPATLIYAGYIGGSGAEFGNGIAVDTNGNAYITGSTTTTSTSYPFPTKLGPDLSFNGALDAFVAKVRADGTGLIYAGYIGGSARDTANGIAVDRAGSAYVVGYTESPQATFPRLVGPDLSYNGGALDVFVAKVRPDGLGLLYSGYVGGRTDEAAFRIAVDAAGNAYIMGLTDSLQTTFPDGDGFGTLPGPDRTYNGGISDAFVAKVKANGSGLAYATYIGGSGNEIGAGIAVDGAGNAYAVGTTSSTQATFPDGDGFGTLPGVDKVYNGGINDAFVAKIHAAGTVFSYASFIGGNLADVATGVAVDKTGNAYVVGFTQSLAATFPVRIGPRLAYRGGTSDGFITKVNATGAALVYSGYIGRTGADACVDVAVDSAGGAYVVGETTPPSSGGGGKVAFPAPRPDRLPSPHFLRAALDQTENGRTDTLLVKVRPDGTNFVYAGYIGGNNNDGGAGVAVDRTGNAYITGYTYSYETSFPDGNGIPPSLPSPDRTFSVTNAEAYVAKIGGVPLVAIGVAHPGATATAPLLWYVDANRNGLWNGCSEDRCLGPFGVSSDLPVVGDWTHSSFAKIGVFRPSTRLWYLDLNGDGLFTSCTIDRCWGPFGLSTDIPVVGDWTGTEVVRIGVYRPSARRFYFDLNRNGILNDCTVDYCSPVFTIAAPGDVPVVGDWTGNGRAKVGMFRPATGQWFLDKDGDALWEGCAVDLCFTFGAGGRPVVGDWTGIGKTDIGVFFPGSRLWNLDRNGNGAFNGCAVDLCQGVFGAIGDRAITGGW